MSVINFNYTATTLTQPFDTLSCILPGYICSLILSTRGNSSGLDQLGLILPVLNGAPSGAYKVNHTALCTQKAKTDSKNSLSTN